MVPIEKVVRMKDVSAGDKLLFDSTNPPENLTFCKGGPYGTMTAVWLEKPSDADRARWERKIHL